ncbi:N-acetyltransferase [Sphingomonas sp. 1P06PA]|uniref:GNAT family N-acetyltransferase n=1 Tax=Sphingomonas sp. 1P06PA TaxID=554121 RepID=UPI0039A65E11
MAVRLASLSEADPDAIEALLDAAFGTDRRSRTAYRLREGARPIDDLSLAAFDGAVLAGVLQSWPIALLAGQDRHPLVLVGPVAVAPDRQLGGLGRQMMAAMLARADADRVPLMLVGDPEYYGQFFGFRAAAATGWQMPGPVEQRRVLARLPEGMTLPADGCLVARTPAIAGAGHRQ